MIMNRYNQTGGSNAFLMVFSCAGNGYGAGACGRRRAGRHSRGRGGDEAIEMDGGLWVHRVGAQFEVI